MSRRSTARSALPTRSESEVTSPIDQAAVYLRYTVNMTTQTTIKVSTELRDALQARARREGRSMAEVVEHLIAVDARVRLFDRLRSERVGDVAGDSEWERAAQSDLTD